MAQRLPVELERPDLVSYDPATGEEVGRAPLTMPEEVAHAVIHAREAQAFRFVSARKW